MKIIILVALSFAVSVSADIRFDQLSQGEINAISKEFSANFAHSAVTGAAPLDKLFGFEVGLVFGRTSTPQIDQIVKTVDSNKRADTLLNAYLEGQLTVPFGITAEAGFFPQIGSEAYKFGNMALGVKWTVTELIPDLIPIDIAARMNYTSTNLDIRQTINNTSTGNVPVDSTIEYKNRILSYGIFFGKIFPLFEPYAGYSIVSSKADMSVAGTGTIFDQTVTSGQSASSNNTGSMITIGFNLTIYNLKLGFEFGRIFETNRYLAKGALAF